ncbi:MAG: transglutaminase family protein [Actinomycetota bacterium]
MRTLHVGCEFEYDVEAETPAVFVVQPSHDRGATGLSESWQLKPDIAHSSYLDVYGNRCERMTLPAGDCLVRFDATVVVPDGTEAVNEDAAEIPVADLPHETLIYTLASRYVLPDLLGDDAWRLFGDLPPGYRRVQAICDFVNGHLRFQYGTSLPTTTAADVYAAGVGVCRDFTHLGITFCRALNIPARYVFGYLPDIEVTYPGATPPMDFAAWMEVYLEGGWWTFDPRNNVQRKGRVVIARGRDAGDVAMVTTYGGPVLRRMEVFAEEIEGGR